MPDRSQDASRLFRYTIPPRTWSKLVLQTPPNSVCRVRPEGPCDSRSVLKVYSSPDGRVRFHLRPHAESKDAIKLVVECEAGAQTQQYPIELRAGFEPTADMPAPPDDPSLEADPRQMSPALSEKEISHLPDRELLERGYPIRPTRNEVPDAYRSWRRIVSTPVEVVKPHTVSNPEVQHSAMLVQDGPASSQNWSGFILERPLNLAPLGGPTLGGAPFSWVSGVWIVPTGQVVPGVSANYAMWVGLDDGRTTPDLVQAGTSCQTVSHTMPGSITGFDMSNHYAWTELLPNQPSENVISGLPVEPGDAMFVTVWVGNAGYSPTLPGTFAFFQLINLTQSKSVLISTPLGGTTVVGSVAEWIIERPTLNPGPMKSLSLLADFTSVVMSTALARIATGAQEFVPYLSNNLAGRNKQLTMVNSSNTTLATATSLSSFTLRFDWQAAG